MKSIKSEKVRSDERGCYGFSGCFYDCGYCFLKKKKNLIPVIPHIFFRKQYLCKIRRTPEETVVFLIIKSMSVLDIVILQKKSAILN
jgi:DNA repair photolyase